MTLDKLHYDVVEHIFGYLDVVDIISVQQLTPLLCSYVEEYFCRSEYRRFGLSKTVIDRLSKARCNMMNEVETIKTILTNVGGYILELSVDLSSFSPTNVSAIMQLISEHCDGLTHFTFSSLSDTFDWSMYVPNLMGITSFTAITTSEIDSFNDDVLLSYLKQCAGTLEVLNLKGLTIDGRFLEELTKLKSLSIKELHHNEPYEHEALFHNVSDYLQLNGNLIELRLVDCGSNSLAPLYAHMQNVENLTIRNVRLKYNEDIAGLLTLPKLRQFTLDMYHSSSVVDWPTFVSCIHGLATVDRLKSLTIKVPYKTKFPFSETIMKAFHFTQLEKFKLVANRVDTRSLDSIYHILRVNLSLTRLTLRINRCNISAITESFPNLQYLKVLCHQLVISERMQPSKIEQFHLIILSLAVKLHDILRSLVGSKMTRTLRHLQLSMSAKDVATQECNQLLQAFGELRYLSVLGPQLPDSCFVILATLTKLRDLICSHAERPRIMTNGIRTLLTKTYGLRTLTLPSHDGTAEFRKEFEAITQHIELFDLNYRPPIVNL